MHRLRILFIVSVIACNQAIAQDRTDCVIQAALSQLGTREATGHNDGVAVEKYLASVRLGAGFAWCAAFVNWSLEQCGAVTPRSGWCPNWFPDNKVVNDPRPGDVFGMYFPSKGRIAHMGIILQWGNTSVKTIEGNTNDAGSREGDGVYRKTRLKSQVYKVSRWL